MGRVLPGRLDLECYAGDTFRVILAFTNAGAAYNVTASEFVATLQRATGDVAITVTQESASSLRLAISDTALGSVPTQDRWVLRHVSTDRTWLAGDFVVSLNKERGGGTLQANVVVDTATYTVAIDSVASGSVPASTVTADTTFGEAAAVGTGTFYARNDHKHGSPSLGTTATTAAAGNDPRLSDARTPTAHAASHAAAGADAVTLTIAQTTNLQTTLDGKAPLASPAFTGTPTAPTAAAGTNTTQIASTAFVGTAVVPLAFASHNPASESSTGTTSATFSDVDATNLAVTFTAPASGRVIVSLQATFTAGDLTTLHWNLRSGGADVANTQVRMGYHLPSAQIRGTARIRVTGLTPGSSYSYTWGQARTTGTAEAATRYGGTLGAAIMEVWAA